MPDQDPGPRADRWHGEDHRRHHPAPGQGHRSRLGHRWSWEGFPRSSRSPRSRLGGRGAGQRDGARRRARAERRPWQLRRDPALAVGGLERRFQQRQLHLQLPDPGSAVPRRRGPRGRPRLQLGVGRRQDLGHQRPALLDRRRLGVRARLHRAYLQVVRQGRDRPLCRPVLGRRERHPRPGWPLRHHRA